MSLDRPVVSIRLKLRIHDLPNTAKDDIRTFMQRLEHVELGFCDMQMVTSTVDSKLAQLGVPQVDYRVLHRMIDPNTSQEELVDVDDGYWGLLVRDAVQQHSSHNNGEPMIELMVRVGSTSSPSVALRADATDFADRSSSGGLTRDALHNNNHHNTAFQRPYEHHHQQHLSSSASADVALRVADLLDQPPYSQFHVVGVVGEIRLKRHPILEAEILDEQDPTARITLVCFDEATTNDLRRTLRGNATERVEIRGVGVARKTPKDIQYQSNRHPMLLRVATSGFSVKVVGYIPGGLAMHNSSNNGTDSTATVLRPQVVDVAPRRTVASLGAAAGGASSAGTTTFLSLKTLRPGPASNSSVSGSGASVGSGGSGGSNAGQSSGGRTMLNLTGGLPRPGGLHPSMQQGSSSTSSSSAKAAVAPYQEQGVPQVSIVDVHQRDENLERSERRLDALKTRIHVSAKQRPSTRCILCHCDVEAPQETMEMVREMLTKSRANRGSHVPQLLELLQALADRRPLYTNTLNSSGGSSSSPPPSVTRFYCKASFVDIVHGTCHLVHPRCAHLCDAYQKGQSSMEDIPLYSGGRTCSLCQGSGATVKCYHPDCKEEYHVICALFSHGYVNFGKRDPMLPAPACPKHTQVKCPTLNCRDENITAVDRKRRRDEEQSDNVVFDSAVVQKGDLRDPDEELEGGW